MKTSLLFASLVSLAVLHAARATMFRADYLPIGDVRTDAIITKVIWRIRIAFEVLGPGSSLS